MKNFAFLTHRLWIKVVAPVMAVIATVITVIIYTSVVGQQKGLAAQSREQSEMLAAAVEGGMFDALAVGDNETVRRQFVRLRENTGNLAVYVFDFNGDITFSTHPEAVGQGLDQVIAQQEDRARAMDMLTSGDPPADPLMETIDGLPYQSILLPIRNEARCHHCHGSARRVLGGVQVRAATEGAVALGRTAARQGMLIGLAGIAVLAAAIFLLFRRLVNIPVRRLLDLAGGMRRGDLSGRISVRGKDEISHMSARMNLVNESLRDMIDKIKAAAGALSALSCRQASSLEETSASLEELSSTARKNAEYSAEADRLMTAVQASIDEAAAAMQRLVGAMTEIETSSTEVSAIIRTIDEIAFQTNLLALNAAVEAARAGQAGAGFAVVAEEVRTLARRSAEAAHSTAVLIEGTVARIKAGVQITGGVNRTFGEVTGHARLAVTAVNAVNHASEQQVQGIEQINIAIRDIDSGVQQAAANAQSLSLSAAAFKTDREEDRRDAPVDAPKSLSHPEPDGEWHPHPA